MHKMEEKALIIASTFSGYPCHQIQTLVRFSDSSGQTKLPSDAKPIILNCDLGHAFIAEGHTQCFCVSGDRKHVLTGRAAARKLVLSGQHPIHLTESILTIKTLEST